ncbi:hypothetical protein STEG23_014224, partial [Scotinomys teguina]
PQFMTVTFGEHLERAHEKISDIRRGWKRTINPYNKVPLRSFPSRSTAAKQKAHFVMDICICEFNGCIYKLETEEKVGSTLERIGTGDHFLNITPTAQTLIATINQWDYMKLRSFCKAKDTITKTKHQPTELEKIFTNPTSDRGLISRIYKELKKHGIKTPNSPIEKWAIELNREFTTEEYRMAERHLRQNLNIVMPSLDEGGKTKERERNVGTLERIRLECGFRTVYGLALIQYL